MNKKYAPYWGLTLAYGGVFMLPALVSEGTFLDGLIYAVLGRNLAAGLGSFWTPFFTVSHFPQWYEHPPLAFGLQSVFFRVLGDHIFVEHIYTACTALVTAWLILALWKWSCREDEELRPLGWLPILFWLMNPQTTWSYSNNMLENTMGVFTLGAVLLLLRSFTAARFGVPSAFAAAALIVLGALTKGPVAIFPFSVPVIYALTTGRISWRRAWGLTAIMVVTVAALLGLLLLWPSARTGIRGYLDNQLLLTMSGGRGDVENRLGFIIKLFNTLLPAIGLTLLVVLWGWYRRSLGGVTGGYLRNGLFFLVLALAASLPLVVSPCQSLFYLVPSFPFFALVLGILAAPVVAASLRGVRVDSLAQRCLRWAMLILLLAVVGWSMTKIGTYNRDETMVRDVKAIGHHLRSSQRTAAYDPGDALVVSVCKEHWHDWGLETNFARYYNIGMQRGEVPGLYVVSSGDCPDMELENYFRVALDTRRFHLYQRQQ